MGFSGPKHLKPPAAEKGCFIEVKGPHVLGTYMEVENGPLEDHFPLQTGGAIHFHVIFRESKRSSFLHRFTEGGASRAHGPLRRADARRGTLLWSGRRGFYRA